MSKRLKSFSQGSAIFLIVINRFLAGTRAFVAFFAGLGEFDLKSQSFFRSSALHFGIQYS
jgi:membrane protein DedA with SNARE-associated domain